VLDINTDMKTMGGRHAVLANYKIAYSDDGKVEAIQINTFLNAGCGKDLTPPLVTEYTMCLDGPYFIPNVMFKSIPCLTNLPSRTAVRSFGHIQATTVLETIIDNLAIRLGMPAEDVRQINYYNSRNCITPYGHYIEDWNLPNLIIELKEKCEFLNRKKQVQEFNESNKLKKKRNIYYGSKIWIDYHGHTWFNSSC